MIRSYVQSAVIRRSIVCLMIAVAVRQGPCCLGQTSRIASAFSAAEAELLLKVHNGERTAAGKPPLTWDPDLAAEAQAHAARLAAAGGGLMHTPGGTLQRLNQGENLFATSSPNREQAVNHCAADWAREKINRSTGRSIYVPNMTYRQYQSRYPGKVFGHWTQMIWGKTQKLGMGIAQVRTGPRRGGYVVVARYFPGGNNVSQAP
ncbi:MAG: CAP domain-containing protein [Fuerstiella sp.]